MNFSAVITVYFFTINMSCHAEVTFIQLLNSLKTYYVYSHYMFGEFMWSQNPINF